MTVWLLLDFSVYFKPHLFAEYCQLTNNTKTYHFLSVHITLTSKLCWIWERWKKELQNPQIVGKNGIYFDFHSSQILFIWILQKIQKPLQWVRELWLQFDTWKLNQIDLQSGIYVILNISKLKGQFFSLWLAM